MTNKLTKRQQEAIDFFEKYNYLLLEAPRRSGKTVLLQEIIARNFNKKVGVITLSYHFFKEHYSRFKNCEWIERLETNKKKYDLIIGDEIYIPPNPKTPTASAVSNRYITLRWDLNNPYIDKLQMEDIKDQLTETAYRLEFGQYDK